MAGQDFLGRGVAFPVRTEPATGRIRMQTEEMDIREAIPLILGTRKGERVMRPEFGCRIHEFAFGTTDYHTFRQMEEAVREALILWEPRIEDIRVQAGQDEGMDGVVLIKISCLVRSTNNPFNLVYPFYMNEGSG